MNTLEILKLQLDDFFERSKPQTITKIIDKDELYLNKSLFELEKHLSDLKVKYQVNQNLNPKINSDHILESFSLQSTFFRSNDYALSFLVFLTLQENHDAEELLLIMDQYIDKIKEKLTFHDIATTDTGATRCFTNLRFALNEMRNYGLIYSSITLNKKNCRSILPTPVGYLISLMVNEPGKFNVEFHLPKHGDSSNRFAAPLYTALTRIKNDPVVFLNRLLEKYKGIKPFEDLLKQIMEDYYESVLQFIELTNKGWKVDEKELEKSIKTYYSKITKEVNVSNSLKNVLIDLSKSKPT